MLTNSTLRRLLPILLLAAFWLALLILVSATRSSSFPAIAQEDSGWRMTRFGWVDSRTWDRPARLQARHRVELIHPVFFSALIALFSIALLIWATEEYDWGRLTAKRDLTIREKLDLLEEQDPLHDR